MIDPVSSALHMTKKHRGVGFAPLLVPKPVDLQPLVAAHFAFADVVSHLFIEDLGSTSWHTIHTMLDHQIDHLLEAESILFGQKVHLGSREGFDMDRGETIFYFAKHI